MTTPDNTTRGGSLAGSEQKTGLAQRVKDSQAVDSAIRREAFLEAADVASKMRDEWEARGADKAVDPGQRERARRDATVARQVKSAILTYAGIQEWPAPKPLASCPHGDGNACEQYRLQGQRCQDCPLATSESSASLQDSATEIVTRIKKRISEDDGAAGYSVPDEETLELCDIVVTLCARADTRATDDMTVNAILWPCGKGETPDETRERVTQALEDWHCHPVDAIHVWLPRATACQCGGAIRPSWEERQAIQRELDADRAADTEATK